MTIALGFVKSFDCYEKTHGDDYMRSLSGNDMIVFGNYCEVFMKNGSKIILDNNKDVSDFIYGYSVYKKI